MHPIARKDITKLVKFNIKYNWPFLLRSLVRQKENDYYLSWVSGKEVLMRKGKTDILVFKKIFIDREYDFHFTHDVTTIIDAGANIGLSAIFFANRFPGAKIIALEPEASNYELLLKNIEGYSNIFPVQGAIGNKKSKFRITNKNADHWNFQFEQSNDEGGEGDFYTVKELMDTFGMDTIDFFKIDIEGGEEMLFRDNYEWLAKTRSLSIELHDFIFPHSSNPFFRAICSCQPFTFITSGENHLVTFHRTP